MKEDIKNDKIFLDGNKNSYPYIYDDDPNKIAIDSYKKWIYELENINYNNFVDYENWIENKNI